MSEGCKLRAGMGRLGKRQVSYGLQEAAEARKGKLRAHLRVKGAKHRNFHERQFGSRKGERQGDKDAVVPPACVLLQSLDSSGPASAT